MPTTFQKGDIFHTEGVRAYALGCNCAGSMDAGIAVAFKKRWPRMFEEYHARCADGRFRLGDVFVWIHEDETVYCLALQEHWKKKPNLAALSRSTKRMVELADKAGVARVGVPRVGAGPLGLDWSRVKNVLSKVGGESTVELVVFEQFIRAPGTGTRGAPSDEALAGPEPAG